MDKFSVKLFPRAYRDLDKIYQYIATTLQERNVALHLIEHLEHAILSLEYFPEKGVLRTKGSYGNKGYRQLFVKNYTIVYRVHKETQEVFVVTIRYSASLF